MSDLVYTDEGPRDADAVVLLHGWPSGPHAWRRLAPLLAGRFRVVTPELRDSDLRAQAAAVRSLLDVLGIARYAVVGHGHGGGVAQLLAGDEPAPGTLVLIDTIAFDETPPGGGDPRAFVERGSVEFADLPEADVDAYVAFGAPVPDAIDLTANTTAIGELDVPVLLLWGEDDPFIPIPVAERLVDALGGATLGVVPQSGHFLLDDAFDPVGVMIAEYLRVRYQGAPHGHEGIVHLQLERRPAWVDLAPYEEDDPEPAAPDAGQEVGPHA